MVTDRNKILKEEWKIKFIQKFSSYLEENFKEIEFYIDYDIILFKELETTFVQQYKCLLTESYIASITLTNHILERLLKLALIKNHIGLKPTPDILSYSKIYEEPHRLFSSKKLGQTIELCLSKGLINQQDKDFLFDYIRESIRNGFSHSETDKIFKDTPDETVAYHQSFSEPINPQQIIINTKIVPELQSTEIFDFAQVVAPLYFKFVFHLMISIEKELLKKDAANN